MCWDHADKEYEGRGTVFGQCEDASLPVVAAISHALLSTDNHPAEAIAINHIAVVREGEAIPAVAAAVPLAQVTAASCACAGGGDSIAGAYGTYGGDRDFDGDVELSAVR